MTASIPDRLNRSFGLIMAGGFCTLASVRFFLTGRVSWWMLGLSGGFLVPAILYPSLLDPLRGLWMKLAKVLGFINQRVLLTIVFVLLITPLAVLLRLLGKRPIALGPGAPGGSYWHRRDGGDFTAARMERQF